MIVVFNLIFMFCINIANGELPRVCVLFMYYLLCMSVCLSVCLSVCVYNDYTSCSAKHTVPLLHRLKPLDIEFMKQLHELVNIVPVIAKADTLTPTEVQTLKKRVSYFVCVRFLFALKLKLLTYSNHHFPKICITQRQI